MAKISKKIYSSMAKPVKSLGIVCPFIVEGDDITSIVVDSVIESGETIDDGDVIGITESVVARSQGNYVTADELAEEIRSKFGEHSTVMLYKPIYSRNRFSVILRAFARACDNIVIVMPEVDEVGNVVRNHPFTGLNYDEFYKEICKSENCVCNVVVDLYYDSRCEDSFLNLYKKYPNFHIDGYVDCTLHNTGFSKLGLCSSWRYTPLYTLYDFCSDKCEWGLLGSNKVNDEKLKLFPSKGGAQAVCDMVKSMIRKRLDKNVVVCVYGDGCFHDPVGNINEFADPCTMPGYTDKELIESTPNELKLKELIDNKNVEEVHKALSENGVKKASSMGTTPRLRRDLLASLMDLTSGSGDRATPVVLVKNYF